MKTQINFNNVLLWLVLLLAPLHFSCKRAQSTANRKSTTKESTSTKQTADASKNEVCDNESPVASDPFEAIRNKDGKDIDPSKVNEKVTIEVNGTTQTMPALAAAALQGSAKLLNAMLSNDDANINEADNIGDGLIHSLLGNQKLSCEDKAALVRKLLAKNAAVHKKTTDNIKNKPVDGLSPMHRIVNSAKSDEEAKELVEVFMTSEHIRRDINDIVRCENFVEGKSLFLTCWEILADSGYLGAVKLVFEKMGKREFEFAKSLGESIHEYEQIKGTITAQEQSKFSCCNTPQNQKKENGVTKEQSESLPKGLSRSLCKF